MKIFRIDSYALTADQPAQNVHLMADSCLRPHRKPFFVPDDQPWCTSLRLALRIDRLGKHIGVRFADRYVGAWTVVAFQQPQSACLSDVYDTANDWVDDVVVTGEWMPMQPAAELTVNVSDSESDGRSVMPTGFDPDIMARIVAQLSDATTLKTGDMIILPATVRNNICIQPGIDIQVDTDGSQLLHFFAR